MVCPRKITTLLFIFLAWSSPFIFFANAQEAVVVLEQEMDDVTLGLRQNAESVLHENERLTTENNTLTTLLKQYQEQVLDLQGQITDLQAFLNAHRVEQGSFSQKDRGQQIRDLAEQERSLLKDIEQLTKDLGLLREENAKWQPQADSLKAQKQSLLAYQHKDAQYGAQERMSALAERTRDWRTRVEALRKQQDILAKKMDDSHRAIVLLAGAQSGPEDKRYRQLLRLLNLNGQSATLKMSRIWSKDIGKNIALKETVLDVEHQVKDLKDLLSAAHEKPLGLSDDPAEDAAYKDLFVGQMAWVSGQATDALGAYREISDKKKRIAQAVKDAEDKIKDTIAQNKKLDKKLPQVLAKRSEPVQRDLSKDEIARIQSEIDRYELLTQKAILREEQRLKALLSDLGTEHKVLSGQIADMQADIARIQGEKEVLVNAVGSSSDQNAENMIKANIDAMKDDPALTQKPSWKVPKILQE